MIRIGGWNSLPLDSSGEGAFLDGILMSLLATDGIDSLISRSERPVASSAIATHRADTSETLPGISPELQPLSVCCFGRGGSSLIWHFLGSSPDVWMMEQEWHRQVFYGLSLARRGLKRQIRRGLIAELGAGNAQPNRLLQRWIRGRMLSNLRRDGPLCHPKARYVGVKLMDYNLVWHNAIRTAFGGGRTVLLTRRPMAQCESLMRSGATLQQACNKYNDVAEQMAQVARSPETVLLRFDDFLGDPQAQMSRLFAELDLRSPSVYFAKTKPYGKNRTANTSVSDKTVRGIAPCELGAFVDPDVDTAAVQRLTEAQISEILSRTGAAAQRLGYTDAPG